MSFISGALDKSVFNKGSYAAAIGKKGSDANFQNGYAVVRIQPKGHRLGNQDNSQNDPEIIGVMDYSQGGLTFSVPSNWRDLGGMGGSLLPDGIKQLEGVFDKVNNAAQIGGAASLGSAFASKLIYQQSGYLVINIPMMVVDWQGTGQPLMTAILLANYCLPRDIAGGSMEAVLKEANNWVNEQLEKLKKSENVSEKIVGNGLDAAKKAGEGVAITAEQILQKAQDFIASKNKVAGDALKNYSKTMGEGLKDLTTLRSSPTPVNVQIGQFFKKGDMVIKNLTYTFSKEMTKMGPLYVKFQLELCSRTIMVGAPDTGLFLKGSSRYSEASFTGI